MGWKMSEANAAVERRIGEHGLRLVRQLGRIYGDGIDPRSLGERALVIIRQRAGERSSDPHALDVARGATPDWFSTDLGLCGIPSLI